jgi:hypothetical protein
MLERALKTHSRNSEILTLNITWVGAKNRSFFESQFLIDIPNARFHILFPTNNAKCRHCDCITTAYAGRFNYSPIEPIEKRLFFLLDASLMLMPEFLACAYNCIFIKLKSRIF